MARCGSWVARTVLRGARRRVSAVLLAVFLAAVPLGVGTARAEAAEVPAESFALDSANGASRGVWSDGTTVWVADSGADKVYAYALVDGTRDDAKDISALGGAGNTHPRGMWSDGTTVWVADGGGDKLFAYDLAGGTRDASQDVGSLDGAGNNQPMGIWSDGITVWVADSADDKLFAYDLAGDARDAAKDIDTLDGAGNNHPRGMWSDGTTVWVADSRDRKVYAYVLADGSRDASQDIDTSTVPWGLWSDGGNVWVSHPTRDSLTRHQLPAAPVVTLSALALSDVDIGAFASTTHAYSADVAHEVASTTVSAAAADSHAAVIVDPADSDANTDGHQVALGVGANTVTITVESSLGTARGVYTVMINRAEPVWNSAALDSANGVPRGMWSDGTTVWVADSSADKVYAYALADGTRDAAKDTQTLSAAGNTHPRGMWSNGSTMWIADGGGDKLFAYNLADGARDAPKDIDTLEGAGNNQPMGVWSDGTTVWVADGADDKVYAYDLAGGARDDAKDIDTLEGAGNNHPRGLWSDGTTIWVADGRDDKVYAYDLADGSRAAARDIDTLSDTSTDPWGLWSNGEDLWVNDPTNDLLTRHPLPAASEPTTPEPEPSGDATLSDLVVGGVTLSPTFAGDVHGYTGSVASNVFDVTVAASVSDSAASVVIAPGDIDAGTAGHQVYLVTGDNQVTVTVTAADGVTVVAYTVDITREAVACPQGGYNPVPTAVAVDAVPIEVTSTTDDYFVLYVSFDSDDDELEIPVAVVAGEAGTTALAENVEALPAERYRVEKYLVADPADVDGDCFDDITELTSGYPAAYNPVNSADGSSVRSNLRDGAVTLIDEAAFDTLSRPDEGFVKIILTDVDTETPGVYFVNTNTHAHHSFFLDAIVPGVVEWDRVGIQYNPNLVTPDGGTGAFFWENYSTDLPFEFAERVHTLLAAHMPVLADNLYLLVWSDQIASIQPDLDLYRQSRVNLLFEEDVFEDWDVPVYLNSGVAFGRLRVMEPDERPHPRDVVIYETLPNELPRVGGVITTAYQTRLSHVNLRAVQNQIPNAYIPDGVNRSDISSLIDSYVRYEVTSSGWSIRSATPAEVDAHYAALRPTTAQTPERDLSITEITALSDVSFDDWDTFGVKAANVAELGTLGFATGTVPDGFAIPFYFYDEFMKANGFYDDITAMLADTEFQNDYDVQETELKALRRDIKDAATPQWIIDALTEMHDEFAEGTSLRYRSSTNNEDLPGFNGAGLYDSKTQDPDETEEDGIDKSLKGVFASMWNFGAFIERDFHRVDHAAAAMGVLVHPNYSDELANGVAVSYHPYSPVDRFNRYYVNTQVGEDLVTNPEAHSRPEELVLNPDGTYRVNAVSNLAPRGELLMSGAQIRQLREHLESIHDHFKGLYDPATDEPFAVEIEFKITSDDILAIKQARPWIFNTSE